VVLIALIIETIMSFGIGARDFLPLYFGQELGLSESYVAFLWTVFLVASIPAPYLWGYLSDKIERRKVVMLAMGILAIFWLILSYKISLFYLVPVLIILGFARTGTGAVILAFVANTISHEKLDVIYGMYFTIAFGIGSTSPVILGYLVDNFSFSASFIGVAFTSFLAMIAAYFLKSKK
jgi:MFS family permease